MKLANWVNFANDETVESDYPGGSYVVTVFQSRKRRQWECQNLTARWEKGWTGHCCLRRKQTQKLQNTDDFSWLGKIPHSASQGKTMFPNTWF